MHNFKNVKIETLRGETLFVERYPKDFRKYKVEESHSKAASTNVVKTLTSFSQTIVQAIDRSSIPGLGQLRSSVSAAKAYFDSSQEVYDPICVGFLSVPELFDGSVDLIDSTAGQTNGTTTQEVTLSSESSEILNNALNQSGLDDSDSQLTIVDGDGRAYCLRRKSNGDVVMATSTNDEYPLYTKAHGELPAKLNTIAVPYSFDDAPDLNGLVDVVPTVNVISDLAVAEELNLEYSQLCDVVLSDDPVNSFTAFQTQYSADATTEKGKAKLKVAKEAACAFAVNGWAGVINFITGVVEAIAGMFSSDDIYHLTDNSALVPKQYIAGAVLSVVTTVAQAIGYVITVAGHVAGLALSLGASLVSSVFQAVKRDSSDTRASISYSDDLAGNLKVLHACPFAMDGGVVTRESLSPLWGVLNSAYSSIKHTSYVMIPGGVIVFGPASLDEETKEPTAFNYEFHPFSGIIKSVFSATASVKIEQQFTSKGLRYYSSTYDSYIAPSSCMQTTNALDTQQKLCQIWAYILDPANDLIDDDIIHGSTVLVEADDIRLRQSILFCTYLYFWYVGCSEVLTIPDPLWNETIGLTHPVCFGYMYKHSTEDHYVIADIANQTKFLSGMYQADPDSWLEIIEYYAEATTTRATSGYHSGDYGVSIAYEAHGQLWYTMNARLRDPLSRYVPPVVLNSSPISVPTNFKYEVTVPRYDSETFWLWVSLSIIGAVLVTTTVALVSFKVSKFVKQKRARNRAKFNSAQEAYNMALDGDYVEYVTDPETGKKTAVTRHVDPSSAEGKALIQDTFTNLKKTSRSNNLWASAVGGTRYDYSSFWGEKEVPERAPLSERLTSLLHSDEDPIVQTTSEDTILRVICGNPPFASSKK